MTVPPQFDSAAPTNGAPKLKRSMGLWMATALVVGNMVGSGVFLLPATLAGTAGPISMLGWLFTGAGAILLALVFANLGRALPRQGGPYAYARRAFGDFVGLRSRSLATSPCSGPRWATTTCSARSSASGSSGC